MNVIRPLAAAAIVLLLTACDGAGDSAGAGGATASDGAVRGGAAPEAVLTPLPAALAGPLRVEPGGFHIEPAAPVSLHAFEVTLMNTGTTPLTVEATRPSCLCTAPEDIVGTVIPAGGSVVMPSSFRAPTELGEKVAKVQVVVGDGSGQRWAALVRIEAQIELPVDSNPPFVDALGGKIRGQINLRSRDEAPFRLLSAGGRPPIFIDGYEPGAAPRNAYAIRWELEPRSPDDCEGAPLWYLIETDRADVPVIPLRIRHECTGVKRDTTYEQRGWRFVEYGEFLGLVHAGEPVDVRTVLLSDPPGTPVDITSVRCPGGEGTVELVGTSQTPHDHTEVHLRFTPKADYRGALNAWVEYASPKGSKAIAFLGRVVE